MKANPIIELQNVSKKYQSLFALRDVSLAIEENDVYGVIGLSGAGKSTFIRSLARLVLPTSGRVLFHGQDLGTMTKQDLRSFHKNIGMIFQHFNLLSSRTASGNIAYPLEIVGVTPEARQKRVNELLALVGLEAKKDSYPSQLSGGEKQRVGIARALANHPEVLFCDEATSALDPKTTHEILSLLKSINKSLGITIVLITHEMEVVKQLCNKVAVMEKGGIVENGPITEIFSNPQHPITKRFLQTTTHSIPEEFFQELSSRKKMLRLKFTGKVASEPILSEIVRKFQVDANILLGWIDRIQTLSIGTLIIELAGNPENIEQALRYFNEKTVHYEEIVRGEL